MPRMDVSSVANALMVFVDIVDSSRHSYFLGYKEYAKKLLEFQELFERIGKMYFAETNNRAEEFTRVRARGDEGHIFYISLNENKADLVYLALEFVFELKGRLFLTKLSSGTKDTPAYIGLGAGIHFGPVACITRIESGRSFIDEVEGFSINYAKRVESCSRIGNYSHVFLSKEAAILLEGEPIIFSKKVTQMKGIEEHAEVYEIQAGLFHNIPYEINGEEDEKLICEVCHLAENPTNIREPWLKSFVVSVLDSLLIKTPDPTLKQKYNDRLEKLAWHSAKENDPILLFIRARDYQRKKEYTAQIRYLKRIIENYPEFIHARKKLVEACWTVIKSKSQRAEKVYAKDVAKEFLEKFPDYLTDQEKTKFRGIVSSKK